MDVTPIFKRARKKTRGAAGQSVLPESLGM